MVSQPVARAMVCLLLAAGMAGAAMAQLPEAPAAQSSQQQAPGSSAQKPLATRPAMSPQEAEALRKSRLPYVNGVQYDQPSTKDLLIYYANDTYVLPGQAYTFARATFAFARAKPSQWGQDWAGFGQRLGAAEAVTAINGTTRLGMELAFHEDLRYIPCLHCSFKHKLENALLAEVTARHGEDGKRMFSLTPVVADFSGPILYHSTFAPEGFDPMAGVIGTRVVAVTRVGIHMAQEYWVEHRHKHDAR